MQKLHPVLAEKIRPLVQDVKNQRLWERLTEIVQKLGIIKPSEGSTFSHPSSTFQVEIKGKLLRIYKLTYAMGGDHLSVDYDGKMVFKADEVQQTTTLEEFPEQIYLIIDPAGSEGHEGNDQRILVITYIPGLWTELIVLDKLVELVKAEEKKKLKAAQDDLERKERARPYTEQEQDLAKSFGLSDT